MSSRSEESGEGGARDLIKRQLRRPTSKAGSCANRNPFADQEEMTSPSSSGGGGGQMAVGTLHEVEERMREQIKVLQEERAAAMMTEIVDLQRERDVALGKMRRMERSVAEVQKENKDLRAAIGGGEVADRIMFLERALAEERLLSSDLRKKLKTKRESLHGRLSVVASERERSKSLTDLKAAQDKPPSNPEEHSMGSTPQLHITQEHKAVTVVAGKSLTPSPRQKRHSIPSISLTAVASGNISPKLSPSPGYSPTIIPRRYKLAAAMCRDAGTQTDVHTPVIANCDARRNKSDQLDARKRNDESDKGKKIGQSDEGKRTDQSDTLPPNIVDALDSAKADVLRIQEEKKALEACLSVLTQQRQKDSEREKLLKRESESLQTECSVLRDSLSNFSRWTRQKLQLMEEDLDIFRVVYSLHGSLSQETSLLEEMKRKLRSSEVHVMQVEGANERLSRTLSELEEKYRESVGEIRLLREQLSLCNSPLPPSHHNLSSPVPPPHNQPSSNSPLPPSHHPLHEQRHKQRSSPATRHAHRTSSQKHTHT